MLAGDADRDRAVNVLKDAFTEGRLTQDEYEERIGRAYQARTYGELDLLTGDIPHPVPAFGPPVPATFLPYAQPVPKTNSYAIGSLACGIAGLMLALPAVPAVVLGHMARKQIKRTGEQGEGMAVAGLVMGYVVCAAMAIVLVFLVIGIVLIANGG